MPDAPLLSPSAPTKERIALCLSGGGLRAALLHLGATRRLAELGILHRLDLISGVSGGSVLAAFLTERLRPWPTVPLGTTRFDALVAQPFRHLAASNLRRGLWWHGAIRGSLVEGMRALYHERLSTRSLETLPETPRVVLNATDLNFGANWVFERTRVGSYRAGYANPQTPEGAARWTVARAVAASSCFPPVFRPMKLRFETARLRGVRRWTARYDELARRVRLSDGGLYDNLGLQPALSARNEILIVSDGGAPFRRVLSRGRLGELMRYAEILQGQVGALRRSQLLGTFRQGTRRGAYWHVGGRTDGYREAPVEGYSAALAGEVLAAIRTDLDGFSEAERCALENHGYTLCAAALATYLPDLGHTVEAAPARIPFPTWMDEARVRDALRGSGRRRLFGRRYPLSTSAPDAALAPSLPGEDLPPDL